MPDVSLVGNIGTHGAMSQLRLGGLAILTELGRSPFLLHLRTTVTSTSKTVDDPERTISATEIECSVLNRYGVVQDQKFSEREQFCKFSKSRASSIRRRLIKCFNKSYCEDSAR